jgi:tetratricopeptide (TPR) repeat protein
MQGHRLISTRMLQHAAWLVLAALVAVLAVFASYYIWDRYLHTAEKSPAERNIEALEETIHQDPRDPDARIVLAESYLRTGRYAEALEQAKQVSSLYPDNPNALLIAGICYVRLDQPKAALRPLQRFIDLRRDLSLARSDTVLEAAYYYLGESYLKLDRAVDAIPVLEEALLIVPTDADALYQAGLAYQATDQPQTALERYHGAVRLVPDFTEAYQEMAGIYANLGQPGYENYALGMVAFSRQEYRQAMRYLEKAVDVLPDFAPALLGAGLVYERLGQLDKALPPIQYALELNPDDFATQQAAGRIEQALKQEN